MINDRLMTDAALGAPIKSEHSYSLTGSRPESPSNRHVDGKSDVDHLLGKKTMNSLWWGDKLIITGKSRVWRWGCDSRPCVSSRKCQKNLFENGETINWLGILLLAIMIDGV